jgi:hypothetical protein
MAAEIWWYSAPVLFTSRWRRKEDLQDRFCQSADSTHCFRRLADSACIVLFNQLLQRVILVNQLTHPIVLINQLIQYNVLVNLITAYYGGQSVDSHVSLVNQLIQRDTLVHQLISFFWSISWLSVLF